MTLDTMLDRRCDWDFQPKWRHCASLHNQKDNDKFKNKKQPELAENQTVWKSDNQGVKEETFIQTGRRVETGSQVERTRGKAAGGGPGRVSWQLADWEKQWLVDWAVPCSRPDKLWGDN